MCLSLERPSAGVRGKWLGRGFGVAWGGGSRCGGRPGQPPSSISARAAAGDVEPGAASEALLRAHNGHISHAAAVIVLVCVIFRVVAVSGEPHRKNHFCLSIESHKYAGSRKSGHGVR